MSDRYQEQKFVGLASLYTCELLLLGLPILFAVQDSAAARYMVIAGVIFLTDTGVISLVFVPKIKFQKDGVPEGHSIAQSMNIGRLSRQVSMSSFHVNSTAEISKNGLGASTRGSSSNRFLGDSSAEVIKEDSGKFETPDGVDVESSELQSSSELKTSDKDTSGEMRKSSSRNSVTFSGELKVEE